MRVKKIIVDADLLIGHVLQRREDGPSVLRRLMSSFFCYTTVFGAIEAFGACRTDEEREAVERSMQAMKILGLNAKSGKNLGLLFAAHGTKDALHLLSAGVCKESRLPIVTDRPDMFEGIDGLTVVAPEELMQK